MHNKYCVIDNSVVITGSYNWTYYAENRNQENIVISSDEDLVSQYKVGFNQLIQQYSKTSKAPKLSWDDVSACQNVDFEELNYEVDSIAKIQHLPERKVFHATNRIDIIDRPLKPVSKYNVVMRLDDGIDKFVHQGDSLPKISDEICVNSYADKRSDLRFILGRYKQEDDVKNDVVLLDRPITDIANNRNDDLLHITIQVSLLPDGHLNATIRCAETGKVINLSVNDPNLVTYED